MMNSAHVLSWRKRVRLFSGGMAAPLDLTEEVSSQARVPLDTEPGKG
jgi:hypothetical protein